MSCRSATRLVARCTAPIWVRSPNFSTVAIRLTTTAANSSYWLCRSGLSMSPTKKPKFNVAARTTKNPKTTFSRFIRPPPRSCLAHDLGGGERGQPPGAGPLRRSVDRDHASAALIRPQRESRVEVTCHARCPSLDEPATSARPAGRGPGGLLLRGAGVVRHPGGAVVDPGHR